MDTRPVSTNKVGHSSTTLVKQLELTTVIVKSSVKSTHCSAPPLLHNYVSAESHPIVLLVITLAHLGEKFSNITTCEPSLAGGLQDISHILPSTIVPHPTSSHVSPITNPLSFGSLPSPLNPFPHSTCSSGVVGYIRTYHLMWLASPTKNSFKAQTWKANSA